MKTSCSPAENVLLNETCENKTLSSTDVSCDFGIETFSNNPWSVELPNWSFGFTIVILFAFSLTKEQTHQGFGFTCLTQFTKFLKNNKI